MAKNGNSKQRVLRIAKERGLDPQRLLRVSFQSLQGMTFGTLGGAPAEPEAAARKRPSAKSS